MVNVTLSVPADFKNRMECHKHVKWSAVIRTVIEKKLDDFEVAERLAAKSRLTAEDVGFLSAKVEQSMGKHASILQN